MLNKNKEFSSGTIIDNGRVDGKIETQIVINRISHLSCGLRVEVVVSSF